MSEMNVDLALHTLGRINESPYFSTSFLQAVNVLMSAVTAISEVESALDDVRGVYEEAANRLQEVLEKLTE